MDHHPPPGRAARCHRRSFSGLAGLALLALVGAACSADSALVDEAVADRPAQSADPSELALEADEGPSNIPSDDVGVVDDEVEPLAVPFDSVDLVADDPEVTIEEIARAMADPDAGGETLDAVAPVDQVSDEPPANDGRTRNGVGELVTLDDDASLACAQVEIAIGHLDEALPGAATERVRSGADWAESSALAGIQAWAEPLRAAVADGPVTDPAALIGFLSVCTRGGYEL